MMIVVEQNDHVVINPKKKRMNDDEYHSLFYLSCGGLDDKTDPMTGPSNDLGGKSTGK